MKNTLKITFSIILISIALSTFAAIAFAQVGPAPHPKPYSHHPEKVYIPNGFDDNDNVQVVATGFLKNSCHELKSWSTYFEADTIHIRINAIEYFGRPCMDALIPYTITFDVGVVANGVYPVVVDTDDAFISAGMLKVMNSKLNNPKNFEYAPVGDVEFRKTIHGSPVLILSGMYTSACMQIRDVMSDVQNDIVVLHPIMQVDLERNCAPSLREFEYVIPAPVLSAGKYLIHTRTMNGQSVNKVITVTVD